MTTQASPIAPVLVDALVALDARVRAADRRVVAARTAVGEAHRNGADDDTLGHVARVHAAAVAQYHEAQSCLAAVEHCR